MERADEVDRLHCVETGRMKKAGCRTVMLIFLCTGVLSVGCGPGKEELIRRGDANMSLDRPTEAVRHYGDALKADSRLVEDAAFMAKLRRAKSVAAYQEGTALSQRGNWERAIGKLRESVDNDPGFGKAGAALTQAKRAAAKAHHAEALKYADQGQLNRAIGELERALELDPDNLDAKDALQSVRQRKGDQSAKARELYGSSVALQQDRKWLRSGEVLTAALALNPNHLLCRVNLHRSRDALARARREYLAGWGLLDRKRLDDAIAALSRALEIWPFFDQADEALALAKARRKEAEGLYVKAAALAKDGRWDDAVGATSAALAVYPYHQQARDLLPRVNRKAAAAHCLRGSALLAGNDLEGAEREFLRAMDYVGGSISAREGLAKADTMRGLAAEKKKLWGNALLCYLKATDHLAKGQHAARLEAVRRKVLDRISFTTSLSVSDADGGKTAYSAQAQSRILAEIRARQPRLVMVTADDKAPEQAAYAVTVRVARPVISRALVRRSHRTHRYTVYRQFANPEIPRLRNQLRSARLDLDRFRRDFARTCTTCRGTGHLTCHTCRGAAMARCGHCAGSGRVTCAHCRGKGKGHDRRNCARCGAVGKRTCSTCRGHGLRRCSTCGGLGARRGRMPCPHCRGRGRPSSLTQLDINRHHRCVSSLEMRLRHAPAMVTRPCPATWSYVVCYHTRSGTLAASIEVTAQAGGAATETFTVREALRWDDTTIENANPRIGLRADSLNLPSDRTIRDNLLRSASSQAAVKIIASVLKARIARVRAEAARASSQGNAVQSLEATVDLAHLVGWSDARGGRHMLDALHAGHKSQALGGAPGNVTLILPSPRPAPSSALSRTGPDK